MRPSGRALDQLRAISLEINVSKHAEGSCLASLRGDTHVLCTRLLRTGCPVGFVMLVMVGSPPNMACCLYRRPYGPRGDAGKTRWADPRNTEVDWAIHEPLQSRSTWRAQIRLDCDVLQADGGTRTASVTGAYVALQLACRKIQQLGLINELPFKGMVAAVSCGLYRGEAALDLDYDESSNAQADTNFVLTDSGQIVNPGYGRGGPVLRGATWQP